LRSITIHGWLERNPPEAAYSAKASTMYICIDWKLRMVPAPTSAIPWSCRWVKAKYQKEQLRTMSGTIQCTFAWTVQPVSRSPTGSASVPGTMDAVLELQLA
jgi:hypothetical protein